MLEKIILEIKMEDKYQFIVYVFEVIWFKFKQIKRILSYSNQRSKL